MQLQYASAPSNELKGLFDVLTQLLVSSSHGRVLSPVLSRIVVVYQLKIPFGNDKFLFRQVLEDALQLKRLQCVIDGYMDEDSTHYEGMLGAYWA